MFVAGALIALLIVVLLLVARMDERIGSLETAIHASSRRTEDRLASLSEGVSEITEIVTLSLPARVRDRLAFRNAQELTVAQVRLWPTGKIVRLIEADWDPDHEDPMISKYEFRFRSVDEYPEGELGYKVNGEWRFAMSEAWKEYTFRARERSADARLL